MLTIRVISYTTESPWSARVAGLLICVVLSGCGANFARDDTSNSASTNTITESLEPYQSDPILFFVGSANNNQKGQILDPATGKEVQVFAGRAYNAASGRQCRRYQIFEATESTLPTTGLACRDQFGQWQKIRPLLNLDNSRISTFPK